jgi:3-oxoacyl-[acyl-carrier-protein] synthase I
VSAAPIAIRKTGLITSVGLSAPASCAAFRAKLTNPSETRFIDSSGNWIMAHQVTLEQPWRGLTKLAKMAAMAIDEAMEGIERKAWREVPLLLCVAEKERPGRIDGLDDRLLRRIEVELGTHFAPGSTVVPLGRVSVAAALRRAQALIAQDTVERVLVAATDSLLMVGTLDKLKEQQRLLSDGNSNGFMPGEGAGALLLSEPSISAEEVVCLGVGEGIETATIMSEEPMRAAGMTAAIKQALLAANNVAFETIDVRVSDVAGEQYGFKEAALSLARLLRGRRENPDLWHPAEAIGDTGSAIGAVMTSVAAAGLRDGLLGRAPVLLHAGNDGGQRAAWLTATTGARQ